MYVVIHSTMNIIMRRHARSPKKAQGQGTQGIKDQTDGLSSRVNGDRSLDSFHGERQLI